MDHRSDVIINLKALDNEIEGEVYFDDSTKIQYATDASIYREIPLAVIRPKTVGDIQQIIRFANANKTTIIPRAAGTSLAGQVVGNGIIVDISKHFTGILEVNKDEKWVAVQPGVVLDELNYYLRKYNLFFAPETSTSNRCTIGGMVGNNACGLHSLIYGSTRDHLLSVKAILSDGSEVVFQPLKKDEFLEKTKGNSLENKIYRHIYDILSDKNNRAEIRKEFPDPKIKRRNSGYAVDLLLDSEPFSSEGIPFNFCKLLAGSEGTLAFITEIKLNLIPLPSWKKGLLCVHFRKLEEALNANNIALTHDPAAIELMDRTILDCTSANIEQKKNRFFIEGDPGAILIIELTGDSYDEIEAKKRKIESEFKESGYGYHFPLVTGPDIQKVWDLRKAGLGVLSNLPGDAKPVSVMEDTAVNPVTLPDYVTDFRKILAKNNLDCVFHAHISTGELHIRPVLNLKDSKDVEILRSMTEEVALLVKKYNGSLSGEHGDGRVRGEFIPLIIGERNYQLLRQIKKTWDPDNIFNAGKITDTPVMNTHLRFEAGQITRDIDTYFDFSGTQGILRMIENCNGSADCRKSEIAGGVMCPSYMATRDENKTTRARANVLREFLTHSSKKNPFNHKEIYRILDLCLSCKGCKSECPSNVDMAKLKAEFLQHYYDSNGIPLRTRLIANITTINRLGALMPRIYNLIISNIIMSSLIKRILGFAKKRRIPKIYKTTLRSWIDGNQGNINRNTEHAVSEVVLFIDEFTNYNDVETGIVTIKLLNSLGYKVSITKHKESGRTFITKGLLKKARAVANRNVEIFKDLISESLPLIGIEPSSILSFRDEYPDLVDEGLKNTSRVLAKSVYTVDEFIYKEFKAGNIKKDFFTDAAAKIKLHGHCQQKSISSTEAALAVLSIPDNYSAEELKSGCCGMAGSFGYEKEHYELSMKIGEMVLFPEIRKCQDDVIISAQGISCRQQIEDGTGVRALHPAEVLYNALKAE
ncbi:MAG: FAD-binding protein [Bacteroidales bacterium]|nr:MAG: FAD-binding protein [Bacteroidales bacterium]